MPEFRHLRWILLHLILVTATAAAQNALVSCAPGVTDGVSVYVASPPNSDFLANAKLHCGTAVGGVEKVGDGWSRIWIGTTARQYYVRDEAIRQSPPLNEHDLVSAWSASGTPIGEYDLDAMERELVRNIRRFVVAGAFGITRGCFSVEQDEDSPFVFSVQLPPLPPEGR